MVKKIEKIDVNEAFKKIGKKISERRKSLRKKYPGISKKLNISVTYLKYIEEGKIDKIPDHVPAKGFVKTYAKLLNVDIDDELVVVEQNLHNIDHSINSENSRLKRAPKAQFLYLVLVVLFFLFVFYLINFENNRKDKNSESVYGLANEIGIN